MKPKRNRSGVTAKDATPPRESKVLTDEQFGDFERKLAIFQSSKKALIDAFDLPVKDESELNFAVWRRPYRIVTKVSPTIFLYTERPVPGDPSTLYGTRQIKAIVRPFKDRDLRVIQTKDNDIHTFYLVRDANDILPNEDDDYEY